jgi:hypothetical protein
MSLAAIRTLAGAAGGGPSLFDAIMDLGPVGYWPLFETSGTTATDYSGNNYHGTYGSAVTLADVAGPDGYSYPTFSSSANSQVEVGHLSAFNLGNNLTVFALVRPTGSSFNAANSSIVGKQQEWHLWATPDRLELNRFGTGAFSFSRGAYNHYLPKQNEWDACLGIAPAERTDRGKVSKSNPKAVTGLWSTATGFFPNVHPLRIGRHIENSSTTQGCWVGSIAHVAIFPKILTESEIEGLMTAAADVGWYPSSRFDHPALSSGFSIESLRPNLAAWFDASDTTTITDAGSGAVSEWRDKSGWGQTVVETDNTRRPLTGVSSQNGLNVLQFDGSNDRLQTGVGKMLGIDNRQITVCVAFKPDRASATSEGLIDVRRLDGGTDLQNGLLLERRTSNMSVTSGDGSNLGFSGTRYLAQQFSASDTTNYHTMITRHSTSGQSARYDGVAQTLSTYSGSMAMSDFWNQLAFEMGFWFGARGADWPFQGKIAEVIVFDKALSDTECGEVETYLNTKWGL